MQRWAHFHLKYPCWALCQQRKSCWLVYDWVFVRRDRTKNVEDKTSGGRGAKGDVKMGKEGKWGRGTGGLPRASAGAENLSEIGYCADGLHLLWQGVIAKSPPPPLMCPPPPLGSVHYHCCLSGTRDGERHSFPNIPSEAHLAVKCSGCISTLWKVWSKHRQGHSHHYKLLDVSFARPVALQNVE